MSRTTTLFMVMGGCYSLMSSMYVNTHDLSIYIMGRSTADLSLFIFTTRVLGAFSTRTDVDEFVSCCRGKYTYTYVYYKMIIIIIYIYIFIRSWLAPPPV